MDTSATSGTVEGDGSVPNSGAATVVPPRFAAEPVKLSWSQPDGLIGLSFANYFLRIITLGVYNFWGKTEVRRRIWSATRLNGEPLAYTGTGKELFVGFLIIFGAVVLPMTLMTVGAVLAFGPEAVKSIQGLVYAVFFVLMGIGIYRAQRYRMSRTLWRGIRGGLEGRARSYAWTHVWTGALVPFTLGWIVPWRQTKLQSQLVNNMRFGTTPLSFDAKSRRLYKRFTALWFGTIILALVTFGIIGAIAGRSLAAAQQAQATYRPTVAEGVGLAITVLLAWLLFAIISAWYRAGMMNHFAAHTHFEGATFKGTATAPSLIRLAIGNFFLSVGTLGILSPVAQVRSARYAVERTAIDGDVPLAAIGQRAAAGGKYGEGLAQAFDFDAF